MNDVIGETSEKAKRKNDERRYAKRSPRRSWIYLFPLSIVLISILRILWSRLANPESNVISYPYWSHLGEVTGLTLLVIIGAVTGCVGMIIVRGTYLLVTDSANRRVVSQWGWALMWTFVLAPIAGFLLLGGAFFAPQEITHRQFDDHLYVLISDYWNFERSQPIILYECDAGGWWCQQVAVSPPSSGGYGNLDLAQDENTGHIQVLYGIGNTPGVLFDYDPDSDE